VGASRTGFTRLGAEITGLASTNRLAQATIAINRIMEDDSGVALGDVDGDGPCDVYPTSLGTDNHLDRNLGGWKFSDITERTRVAFPGQCSTGAVLADVDGDGDLDLFVNGIGVGTRLFINEGDGAFRERKDGGLLARGGSHSLALADEAASALFERLGLVNGATFSELNGDGYPDLAVACEWGTVKEVSAHSRTASRACGSPENSEPAPWRTSTPIAAWTWRSARTAV
jgi:hypothetical protein